MSGLIKRGATWYIRYTVPDGKRKWEAIGTSKRRAELVLAKRKTDIKEQKYFPTPEGYAWTVNQLFDRYEEYSKVTKKPSTCTSDGYLLPRLRQVFGELLLKDVTPDKVNIYLEEQLRHYSPSTCRYHLSLLKHAFNVAVHKWKILRENPLRDVRLPVKVQNERKRYLTPQEIDRLLSVCPVHLKRLILTALHTGMRKGEIVTLRWEQVYSEQRFVLLSDTKNGEGRPVPLNATMIDLLKEIQAEQRQIGVTSPFVFVNPNTSKPYRRDSDTAWQTALRNAKLSDVHFHDLRHTTASHLRMQGVDMLTLQELLGHKDGRMTKRYAHADSAHRLAAVAALERAYQLPAPKK